MQTKRAWLVFILVFSLLPSCKRKPPSLEALDTIDRRVNVPMVEPVTRDLDEIRKRGELTVLAPYNSTTYFIYQGKPPSLEALDTIDRRVNVPMVEPVTRDLDEIRKRGELTVLAPYNSTTYFIYQGEPLG